MAGRSRGLKSIALNTMVNLNTQIDFKDINLKQITKSLTEHQNTLIKLVLIGGSLILAVVMFNNHRAKDAGLRTQVSQEQQKILAITAHETAAKDLTLFRSSIRKRLNEFELTVLISNYAKTYHIKIPSLSPGESKNMVLYDIIDINFNAVADNFKDMMLFLRKIEKSEYPLRVNSWSGAEDQSGEITFEINISAVLIHP